MVPQCLHWAKKGLFVLGFKHRLIHPGYCSIVQLLSCLVWSGSSTQILIHVSGEEWFLQREENIRAFFFCFDKPNLYNSQLTNVQLVSSLFRCSQIGLSSKGSEIPSWEFIMLYVILLTQIWITTLWISGHFLSQVVSTCVLALLLSCLLSRLYPAADVISHLPQQLLG